MLCKYKKKEDGFYELRILNYPIKDDGCGDITIGEFVFLKTKISVEDDEGIADLNFDDIEVFKNDDDNIFNIVIPDDTNNKEI